MEQKKIKNITLTVKVTKEFSENLKKRAKEEDRTIASLVRVVINNYLESVKD